MGSSFVTTGRMATLQYVCYCCCFCCCFSHSAHWLPTRQKLLYTVANPARGLLNRGKKGKGKVWQHQQEKDQPGKVANPARGQLNRENEYFPVRFALKNLVSRDGFESLVPRQPAHLHTQAESGAYSRGSSRFPRRRQFIYLNRHEPSGQSRVYRVMQLRTGCVHCRESAGTGPVNLKVVPNGCCLGRSLWTN